MRAYAINREGTAYGAVISFTTLKFADVDVITEAPKTGDNSSPWLVLLMMGAASEIVGLPMTRRKHTS